MESIYRVALSAKVYTIPIYLMCKPMVKPAPSNSTIMCIEDPLNEVECRKDNNIHKTTTTTTKKRNGFTMCVCVCV